MPDFKGELQQKSIDSESVYQTACAHWNLGILLVHLEMQ